MTGGTGNLPSFRGHAHMSWCITILDVLVGLLENHPKPLGQPATRPSLGLIQAAWLRSCTPMKRWRTAELKELVKRG
jgi:hypothetical protein